MNRRVSPGHGVPPAGKNSCSYGGPQSSGERLSDSVRSDLNGGIPAGRWFRFLIVVGDRPWVVADREGCRVRTHWEPDKLIGAWTLVESD